MNEHIMLIFALILIAGAVSTWLFKDPYKKLMTLGLMSGAIMPYLVIKGYHDVAIAVALIMPISTIMILNICRGKTSEH